MGLLGHVTGPLEQGLDGWNRITELGKLWQDNQDRTAVPGKLGKDSQM
jgi:hypothetical protein